MEPRTLNASTDMTRYHHPNMVPDDPTQDSTPLLQNAFKVAANHGYSRIVADTGTYWFKSEAPDYPGKCIVLRDFPRALVIDLQGSSLIFTPKNCSAIYMSGCSDVTLTNFTLDFEPLPFTQLTVNGIDSSGQVSVQVQPGFPALRSFPKDHDTYAFVYSSGARNWNTPRYTVNPDRSDETLQLVQPCIPPLNDEALASSFAQIHPGDTLLVEQRTGAAAIFILTGSGYVLRNIHICSSYVQAVMCQRVSQTTIEGVTVAPPPGSPRLASCNAGGLVLMQPGAGCVISNNSLIHTQDDSIAVACLILGTVHHVTPPNEFTLTPSTVPIQVGTKVQFVDPHTGALVRGESGPFSTVVTSVTEQPPSGATDSGSSRLTITTADTLPPQIHRGTRMVPSDPQQRGSELQIVNNRIVQNRFARGMTLFGLINVTVQGNYLHETCMTGIDVLQHLSKTDWQCGPSDLVRIQRNVIELCNSQLASITGEQLGALQIHSLDETGQPVTSMPNVDMTVVGNFVADTPRTGIWCENVHGGSITDNVIQGTSQDPAEGMSTLFNTPEYQTYYRQPLIVLSSEVTAPPVQSGSAPLLMLTPLGGAIGDPVSPGAQVLAVWADSSPCPVAAVVITDSLGKVFVVAPETPILPVVVFVLPASVAPGAAIVTVEALGSAASGGIYVAT